MYPRYTKAGILHKAFGNRKESNGRDIESPAVDTRARIARARAIANIAISSKNFRRFAFSQLGLGDCSPQVT